MGPAVVRPGSPEWFRQMVVAYYGEATHTPRKPRCVSKVEREERRRAVIARREFHAKRKLEKGGK